jgi:hypothetical protein
MNIMKRPALHNLLIPLIVLSLPIAEIAYAGEFHKEIKRTDEQEVRVKMESAFGKVEVEKGTPDKIIVFDLRSKGDSENSVNVDYRIKNSIGYLNLDWNKDKNSSWSWNSDGDDDDHHVDIESGKWYLKFTDAIPLSIDAELGIGGGDFDMSGLSIKSFKISTGASSTTVEFDEPNKTVMDDFVIESGVSKFVGEKLGNANFKTMTFSGGIGTYTLNFDGDIEREVDVHVKIGLGVITIDIPHNVGAKVWYDESWLSNFSIDEDFDEESKGVFVTPNYSDAKGKMNIYVESGLGSVKIRRIQQ